MSKDSTGKKVAVGAVVAAAAGFVAGILTAPKSGKETREEVVDKVESTKDDMVAEKPISLGGTGRSCAPIIGARRAGSSKEERSRWCDAGRFIKSEAQSSIRRCPC